MQKPRENRRGGGIAILYKNEIDFKMKSQRITKSLEYIDCCVTWENGPFELIAVYRPGTNPKDGRAVPISIFFWRFHGNSR